MSHSFERIKCFAIDYESHYFHCQSIHYNCDSINFILSLTFLFISFKTLKTFIKLSFN
jgi:hypothetical protein